MGLSRIFRFSLAISSDTLEMRPALLYSDTQSVVGFSVIPKCMTLSDLEWLCRIKFCFRAGLVRLPKNNCVKYNKDRHIVSAEQIFDRTLVSGSIRFVQIFVGVLYDVLKLTHFPLHYNVTHPDWGMEPD